MLVDQAALPVGFDAGFARARVAPRSAGVFRILGGSWRICVARLVWRLVCAGAAACGRGLRRKQVRPEGCVLRGLLICFVFGASLGFRAVFFFYARLERFGLGLLARAEKM